MIERKRTPSLLLASLAFVALTGLAVSCGEEQPSGEKEKPPQKAESAQKAPETTKPAEKTQPEKTQPEKSDKKEPEKPKADTLPAEGEPAKGLPADELKKDQQAGAEAYAYQYKDSEAKDSGTSQYENGEAAAAPSDPTMYLSIPALGISGTPVIDDNSEAALSAGTMHMPGTGFPWLPGSNTYIAGHRVGYPGTPSDHIFYNLPQLSQGDEVALTDANGQSYDYAVSEIFAVTPFDTWVMDPTGTDTVTLQVCTETPDDWFTIGPSLMSSGPDSGRLIVRATRV